MTQKIDVVVYKLTVKDSVEERILALQEKKRELSNAAIEGGAKAETDKLGMKEILQLFRRDAEHTPVHEKDLKTYSLGVKTRILSVSSSTDAISTSSSGNTTRESSEPREKRTTPPKGRGNATKENAIYGRRW